MLFAIFLKQYKFCRVKIHEPTSKSLDSWSNFWVSAHKVAFLLSRGFMNLLTSGKLNDYLVDIENQAENMFFQIVKQLAESDNITEELKAKDQMEWVAQMNNVCNRTREIVNSWHDNEKENINIRIERFGMFNFM